MIRVLIADTHTVLRHGLRLILQEDPALTVVGEAASGSEIMSNLLPLSPHVILMDLKLPDNYGPEIISQIKAAAPQTQILILTVSDEGENLLPAIKAGAKGFLLKSVSGADVVQAIHQVAAGQAVLPPCLTTHLVNELSAPPSTTEELTDRELDVLQYLTQGLGNKEIATTLNISQNTVKTHVRRILCKLNLRNRTEAATYAMQTGLLTGN